MLNAKWGVGVGSGECGEWGECPPVDLFYSVKKPTPWTTLSINTIN